MSASRQDDVGMEDLNNGLPIEGIWDKFPPLSFEEAVRLANIPNLRDRDIVLCKDHFVSVQDPPLGLTIDEASAIRIYTMDTPFYTTLNTLLRTRSRESIKPFFAYLQLLLLALFKLPKYSGACLFRGTKNLPPSVIVEYRNKAGSQKCVYWGACSSTTTSIETLQSELFCGMSGQRTKFTILNCHIGVNIEKVSALGYEKEVLLPPLTRFRVIGCCDLGSELLEVQLQYSPPPYPVIELTPPEMFLCFQGGSSEISPLPTIPPIALPNTQSQPKLGSTSKLTFSVNYVGEAGIRINAARFTINENIIVTIRVNDPSNTIPLNQHSEALTWVIRLKNGSIITTKHNFDTSSTSEFKISHSFNEVGVYEGMVQYNGCDIQPKWAKMDVVKELSLFGWW